MEKTKFYLNDVNINPPKNWQELEIELNFDKDKENVREQLSINEWEFVRENADTILKYLNDGLGTGAGIFEGIPFREEIEKKGVIQKPFDGYLDLTDLPNLSSIRSTIKVKERMGIDWLNDVADGFTYEYLYKETGEITSNDFVYVPYILNSVPDYMQAAITLVSIFVVAEQINSAVTKISELAAEMSNPFEATAIIRAVIYIGHLVVLLLSIVKLIKDLVLVLIQPVKYHAAMTLPTLLKKGAAHLGLTFKCDFIETDPYDKLVIIPEKYRNPPSSSDERILGFIQPDPVEQLGYFNGTFGDLLRAVKKAFNGKFIITSNNELFLVRQDFNLSQAKFQLGDLYQPYFTTNAHEFVSNYMVQFEVDVTDKNTVQEYLGTIFQVILKPNTVVNQDLVLMKGLEIVRIPFALAKTKKELTLPEKILADFLDVFSFLINGLTSGINVLIDAFNGVIDVLNGIIDALDFIGIDIGFDIQPIPTIPPVNLGAIIENRIGMLKIENDFFSKPKLLLLSQGSEPKYNKIHAQNDTLLSAKELYNQFHIVNSFLGTADNPAGNQRIIKEFEKVPFMYDDYVKVKNNNIIFDFNGNEAEVETLRWNVHNHHAYMKVRFKQQYTKNLRKIELEPDGK